MQQKIVLLFVTVFFGMQVFSLLHTAEHGVETHDHHGVVCDMCVHSQQAHSADVPPSCVLAVVRPHEARAECFAFLLLKKSVFTSTSPRAPPLFS